MRTLAGLDELERRTNGIGGGVGRAAEQRVRLAQLYEHRAEIVALGERGAAVLFGHLALAQLDHFRHHLIHAVIGRGVDDGRLADAEIALFRGSLDLSFITDEDDVHQVLLEKAAGSLEDTGVRTFGKDDGAAGGFECVDQFGEHTMYLQFCVYAQLSITVYNVFRIDSTVFYAFSRSESRRL